MAEKRRQKLYRCGTCGRIFKSQGIGPHQHGMGHQGKTEVGGPLAIPNPLQPSTVAEIVPELPSSMAAPDLALRLLPFSLYEDDRGNRFIVLRMEDMEDLK